MRTRYFAENKAVAYAYGIDANIHGEFVEGIETFFKLGLLSTKEDIKMIHTKNIIMQQEKELFLVTAKIKKLLIVQQSILAMFHDQQTSFSHLAL